MPIHRLNKTFLHTALVLLIVLKSLDMMGQEAMNVPTISLPANACTCSESTKKSFEDPLYDLQEQLELRREQIMQEGVDEESMKTHALDGTSFNQADVSKLMNMSESQQEAYAMQLAQQYMKNPELYTSNIDPDQIKEMVENGQKLQVDNEAILNLLVPIEAKIGKLKHEADLYYEKKIIPMEERLAKITDPEVAFAYEKEIDKAKIVYCKKFTPPHHELLLQEIEACKKADPYLAELLQLKSDEIEGLDITNLSTIDGALIHVSLLLKAFEYRIVSVGE